MVQVGQQIQVEIAEIDQRGKLSLHAVVEGEEDQVEDGVEAVEERPVRAERKPRERRRAHRARPDDRRED